MAAAGVGAIVLASLTQQMLFQFKMNHHLEAKMEALNLRQELTLMLGNDASCDVSFAGLNVSVANSADGDYTDITSSISGTNPLNVIKNSYTTNNRLINITEIKLFKPLNKLGGAPNNTTPYEFKLKMTTQEKGGLGMTIPVDGPTVLLNVSAGITNAADACSSILSPGPKVDYTACITSPDTQWYNCPADHVLISFNCTGDCGTGEMQVTCCRLK